MPSNRLVLPAALAGALLASLAGAALAASDDRPECLDAAREHLSSLGVAAGDVTEIDLVGILGNAEIGNTAEYQAWASLGSCPGSLVVRLTPWCTVKTAYARGGCSLSGDRG